MRRCQSSAVSGPKHALMAVNATALSATDLVFILVGVEFWSRSDLTGMLHGMRSRICVRGNAGKSVSLRTDRACAAVCRCQGGGSGFTEFLRGAPATQLTARRRGGGRNHRPDTQHVPADAYSKPNA